MARNQWFDRNVAHHLRSYRLSGSGSKGIVFAYSNAARDIFRTATERGWQTVLGQIDPGPQDEQIVGAEFEVAADLNPNWTPAPAEYWERWREECELATCILVNSRWSFNCLVEAGVSAAKLRIVPLVYERSLSASPKRYPSIFTRDRPLRVLFLGRFDIRKGAARLLAAAATLKEAPVEFWVVGPVHLRLEQKELRWPNVRWFGAVRHSKIWDFYKNADLFILPTLSDGFAITQLEALSYRLPLIVSQRCGEVVRDEIDGLVLNTPSESAIVEAIETLLHDPPVLQRLSDSSALRPEFTLAALERELTACIRDQ
jgi:glycosyltransferase involved in cell wall biosynthesis